MAVAIIVIMVFSLLNRAVPQMNVFSESFPARTLAGLIVFGLSCNLMAQHITNYLRRLPEDMLRIAQLTGMG
jgi:flagellar biosynthesis protein FliR